VTRHAIHRFLSGPPVVNTGMDAIEEMYRRWAAGDMGSDDQWGDVTAEPRGVDYLEVSAAGVPAMWLNPHGTAQDRVIVAVHGGGFVGGSLYTHRKMYGHLAKAAGVRALLVHYRLAPEFPYPAQIDDAVAAYRWVQDQGVTTALAGDSSGGGLAVHVALRTPGAAALMLLSPWVDMDPAQPATSYDTNAATDLVFTRAMVRGLIDVYVPDGVSPASPAVNALHADLSGLPPMYVQVGANESGLGDSERLAALAEKAGVETRLDVFEGQLHTFQMAAGRSPVADDAIGRFAAWVRPKLGL
jgi:acetyl esterase/lipase